MDSNDIPASGEHWAPAPLPQDAGPAAAEPAPAAQPRTPLTRSKLALVAGAVGLVAAGGIGGFVLGQSSSATAGTTSDTGHVGGTPPWQNGGEGGFSGQLPGGGQFPGGAGGAGGAGGPTT